MGMHRYAERDEVWAALVKYAGNRERAAAACGISVRTLNRYLLQYGLYDEMDKHGFIKRGGPPRGEKAGTSAREGAVKRHITVNKGEIDYGELAEEMYGKDNDQNRQRVYIALSELKKAGKIANGGEKWFVI